MPSYAASYASPGTSHGASYSLRSTAYDDPRETRLTNYLLLKEDDFYLLLESGDKIIIQEAIVYTPTYS